MKLVNEKGKLFGVINIVDLLALLFVALCAAGVGYKLFGPAVKGAVSPQVTMTTLVRIRGAMPAVVENLETNSQVGKKLVSGNEYVADTEVVSVAFEPYVIQAQTADGRIVDAADPSKKDVVIVFTAKVPKDTPVLRVANQEVRVGRTFTFKTNDFESFANIESISFSE